MKLSEKVRKQVVDWNTLYPKGTEVFVMEASGAVTRTRTAGVAQPCGSISRPHVVAGVALQDRHEMCRLDQLSIVPAAVAAVRCSVCGSTERAHAQLNPGAGVTLACGSFVFANGRRVDDCSNASVVALERAALLRACQPLLQFVATQPKLSNEVRPLIDLADRLIAEIAKLPKEL